MDLQLIYEERDNLNIEWQRLLIELSANSRYDLLENWALTNDSMRVPEKHQVVFMNAEQAIAEGSEAER